MGLEAQLRKTMGRLWKRVKGEGFIGRWKMCLNVMAFFFGYEKWKMSFFGGFQGLEREASPR